jgi:hypothetical protein
MIRILSLLFAPFDSTPKRLGTSICLIIFQHLVSSKRGEARRGEEAEYTLQLMTYYSASEAITMDEESAVSINKRQPRGENEMNENPINTQTACLRD